MLRLLSGLRVALIVLCLLVVIAAPALIRGNSALSRAQAAAEGKDYARAGQSFEAAAHLLPWRPGLWEQAAIAYASAGDWGRAMPLFERARGLGALSADGWDVLGTGYWLQSRNADAQQAWSAGLRWYPAQAKFYSRLALAYRALGQYEPERQELERWAATGGATAPEHYRLGQLLMASEPVRAQAELAQAAAADEAFVPAVRALQASLDLAARQSGEAQRLVLVGRGLGLVDDWPLAQQAFEAATRAGATNAQAWAWLGEARQHAGQSGLEQLHHAWTLDSRDPLIAGLYALHYKRQGQYPQQLGWYAAAAQLDPQNPEWQAGMADAHAMLGDLVAAQQAYQKAAELVPDNPTYWRLLAAFCADSAIQVQEVGLPAARKAASLAPNDAAVLDTLGWSYAQAGLLYNAEQSLRKAVKVSPEMALAHLHLGEMYLRKGDPASARVELTTASTLDADGPVGVLAARLLQQYFP